MSPQDPSAPEPTAPPPARTNRLAIAALLSGVLGLGILAVAFAVTALAQIVRRREKGVREKGTALALSAIALSAAWLIALSLILTSGPDRHATSDPLVKDGEPRASTLNTGDCFTGFLRGTTRVFARRASCTQPHGGEVGARVTLPPTPYPGDASLTATAAAQCRDRDATLLEEGREDEFTTYLDRPDRRAWDHGDHDVVCVLRYHHNMVDILASKAKFFSDLTPGDYVKIWDGGGNEETVDCDEKHRVQIYAVIEYHSAAYPTWKQMMYGCSERAVQVFGTHPPGVLERWARPRDDYWMMGQRFVFCLVAARHGSLTRSVMPK